MNDEKHLSRSLILLYLAVLGVMAYFYWAGADSSIDWNITTHAEPTEFSAYEFQKGPFEFSIAGKFYSLTESFSAGPIQRYFTRDAVLLAITWLGICLILAVATFLSRIWFTGIAGLFIFMLINLRLQSVGIFGFSEYSQWGNLILICLFIAPAYAFQAYFKYTGLLIRILTFVTSSLVVVLFSGVDMIDFQEQLNVGIYFSMIVLMLLFLLLVAEENIFGILYLITKNRGGEHNEKHFSFFSLIYLVLLGLVYGKKSGLIRMELPFFDPYVLLIISSLVALWSIHHKRDVYLNLITESKAVQLLIGIGVAVFGYVALSFSRGNDPVFEGLHYFIIYAHLGMGVFFFLYLFVNFVNPLSKGLQVYKIAYKEQSFPYFSARLAGIVAIVAFFLLADNMAFKLFKSGHYNYLGEQAEINQQKDFADQYYIEGSIYGIDNHFSNYKIGYHQLQKGKTEEANHKFGRATLRYPTPQSFINQSATYGALNQVTPSLVSLQAGLKRFPGNSALVNNLGLIYMDLGKYDEARNYFRQSKNAWGWNDANTVNLWKIGLGENVKEDFKEGNLAVKTNVLAQELAAGKTADLNFELGDLKDAYQLHKSTFLINSSWYFNEPEIREALGQLVLAPMNDGMYETSLQTLALADYRSGNVNAAMKRLDLLYHQSDKTSEGTYLNQLGLLCLDQHANDLALGFFDQAVQTGESQALLNKAVALLESGRFPEALNWMQAMAAQDSSYVTLTADFNNILNASEIREEQKALRVYYRYSDYSLAELTAFLANQTPFYIRSLWGKISKELLEAQAFDQVEDYLSVCKPYLEPKDYNDCLAIIALENKLDFKGEHPIAKALNHPDSLSARLIYEEAGKNALNAPLVLAAANHLKSKNITLAYDLLVHAIDINPENTGLLQAYAFAALEMRLGEYALPVVDKLEVLLPAPTFDTFKRAFDQRKQELEEQAGKW
jgi:hypothetical protein